MSGATVNAAPLNVQGGNSTLNHVDVNDSLEVAGYAGFAGTVAISGALSLAGTAVTSTAAEINLLDGSVANTVVGGVAAIYGTTGQLTASAITVGGTATIANLEGVGVISKDNYDSGSIEGGHLSDKVILNASDAHGGLVLSSNKLSVGFRKVAFVRSDGSNISGSVPTKGMFANKAVATPYTTASLSAECQSGSLMVYLNGVLLHGDHPGENAHGPTSADFRLATASNDYKVLLNEDLALDSDDILTVTYLSGALS